MNTYYVLSTMGYMPAALKLDLLSAWRQQMKNFNSRLSEVQQNISWFIKYHFPTFLVISFYPAQIL